MEVKDAGIWRDACLKSPCSVLMQQLAQRRVTGAKRGRCPGPSGSVRAGVSPAAMPAHGQHPD